MDKYDIYNDISARTGGEIFIGVVGPVRTGKSTFITKFMENFVIPNISGKLQKQIATDEMPQSADGKTIMTTQPKFVPANAVKVQFKKKSSANVRLVDCVGYFVDGANGAEENDKPRLVKTPWSNEEIPFEKAAEIGTEKVIKDYSTIGIMVTTDGTIGEIPRADYVKAEEKTVKQLKKCGKPFIIVLNSKSPDSPSTIKLCGELEEKYGVSVMSVSVAELNAQNISSIMETVLMEFPLYAFNVDIPEWMRVLPEDNVIISALLKRVKDVSSEMFKMRDYASFEDAFSQDEYFNSSEVEEIKPGEGVSDYKLTCKNGLYYKVLSDECGENINDDYELFNYIKSFSQAKKEYTKIKDALSKAESDGYGIVLPTIEEMNLEEPALVKQGGRYGVKLKASAPSLHIMKVDVATEVSPLVGTEKQGEDLIKFIRNKFEDNPSGIWETNMFGKSLQELVGEGVANKINAMPKDAQNKMRKTATRIVNENKGGLICILL